jgi:MFS family permease
MLLHQADMLLIGPLTTPIMETFHINEAQMGAVVTGALIVGGVLYPVWGYLYDRYSRPKLLALASFIWGSTTWLSALAPTFPVFVATRASTGIDDAGDPGIYSLLADYFAPAVRPPVPQDHTRPSHREYRRRHCRHRAILHHHERPSNREDHVSGDAHRLGSFHPIRIAQHRLYDLRCHLA